MSSTLQKIYNTIERGCEIKEYQTILQFFESGFSLTEDDRFPSFQMSHAPWVRVLCEWFDDPKVDWIYPVQGSQTTKTTFLMGCLLYVSQYVHGAVPCLWVQSTEEEARQFVAERLRPFLDVAGMELAKSKRWKNEAFRVFNAPVKVGYGSAMATLRSKPARFVFGDECGIWKVSIDYVKKRTRTFAGKRKGVFPTTPPFDGTHNSWKLATSANFYQWFVPCPHCGEFQALRFANLKFEGRQADDSWDLDVVRKTARYQCQFCEKYWDETQKMAIFNLGKAVCVDPETYKPKAEKACDSKALQIPSLYSLYTKWGDLCADFISAKMIGGDSLKIFFTDELAEVPKESGDGLKELELSAYIDPARHEGNIMDCEFYTMGVDVQRKGEIYYCLTAWRRGLIHTGHVVKYGVTSWRIGKNVDWSRLCSIVNDFQGSARICNIFVDASDGECYNEICAFIENMGQPYVALKENNNQRLSLQYTTVEIDPITKQKLAFGQKIALVNSAIIKEEIASAFKRPPGEAGSWSFPAETSIEFLRHLSNEHKVLEQRRTRQVWTWKPKYSGAPQHYFSAFVYSVAAKEEYRQYLVESLPNEQKQQEKESPKWLNLNQWRNPT